MKALAILTLFFLCLTAQAQGLDSSFATRWSSYESERLEPAAALAWSLIIPGAGHYYNGDADLGSLFLGGAIGVGIWAYLNDKDSGEIGTGPIITALILRAFDIVSAPLNARAYNNRLRASFGYSHHSLSLRLEIPL